MSIADFKQVDTGWVAYLKLEINESGLSIRTSATPISET